MRELFRTQFDKLLLMTVLVITAALTVYLWQAGAKELTTWTVRTFDFVLGSLITLVTGRVVSAVTTVDRKDGNGSA